MKCSEQNGYYKNLPISVCCTRMCNEEEKGWEDTSSQIPKKRILVGLGESLQKWTIFNIAFINNYKQKIFRLPPSFQWREFLRKTEWPIDSETQDHSHVELAKRWGHGIQYRYARFVFRRIWGTCWEYKYSTVGYIFSIYLFNNE